MKLFRGLNDTGLNATSSRSHLMIILKRKGIDSSVAGSTFCIVDLAGTEDLRFLLSTKAMNIIKKYYKDNDGKDLSNIGADWSKIPSLRRFKSNTNAFLNMTVDLWKDAQLNELAQGWKDIAIKRLALNAKYKWMSENTRATPVQIEAEFNSKFTEFTTQLNGVTDSNSPYFPKNIANNVYMMHDETLHINNSLEAIRKLLKLKKDSLAQDKSSLGNSPTDNTFKFEDTDPTGKKVYIPIRIVTEFLFPFMKNNTSVIAVGALNPRRTDDLNSYNTMKNIAEKMETSCINYNRPCGKVCVNSTDHDIVYNGRTYKSRQFYQYTSREDNVAAGRLGFICNPDYKS